MDISNLLRRENHGLLGTNYKYYGVLGICTFNLLLRPNGGETSCPDNKGSYNAYYVLSMALERILGELSS